MRTKHTPAPWHYHNGLLQGGGATLGALFTWDEDAPEEGAANVKLITKAPELLHALKSLLESTVGQQTLDKLANGQGTNTIDGQAWLFAKALLAELGAQ